MTKHNLKTWPEYFKAVIDGSKKFEIRYNDRHFEVGDILCLQEYNPDSMGYTGKEIEVEVTYVFDDPIFGLGEGYCLMSIERPKDAQ